MGATPSKTIGFTTVHLVHEDVLRLVAQEKTYRQLYDDKESVDALNSVAPTTFWIIQDALVQEMTLGVARTLLDSAEQGPYSNLGIERVIADMPGENSWSIFTT